MDTYRTEEEQIAAIRKFASEHGLKIITAIVVAIALFFSVQNWQKSQYQSKENASLLYNQLTTAAVADGQMTDENLKVFDAAYATLMADYGDSVYASYASLLKAKLDVQAGELGKAEQNLQWVIDANIDANIKALAVLRLARVKSANGQRDEALSLLQQDPGAFASAYAESKGDILLLQEKKAEALAAYKKAQELKQPGMSMSGQMLKMKIESLDNTQQDKLFATASTEE